jgi:cell division protein FtsA
MAYTNFIAAINLGTSRLTGIIGTHEAGSLKIIACETESSANCMRRGCVLNVKEAASRVKRLIQKLELKIPGNRIGQVYVGIGGQSMRSLEHTLSRTFAEETMLTDEIMDELYEECKAYRPEGLDVLQIMPPSVYPDGHFAADPVGISCKQVEVRFNLIVAQPMLLKHITGEKNSLSGLGGIKIAGVVVAPLALAEVVLSEDEKNRGCALIDMGAGLTSLSVYKKGRLLCLHTIPLGGNLITKDLASYLAVSEEKAEQLKREYANARVDADDSSTLFLDRGEGDAEVVKCSDFNTVVTARLQEILANVYDRLEKIGLKELKAGIVIAGGGGNMENLNGLIYDRLKMEIRYAFVRSDLEIKAGQPDIRPNGEAIGLLLQGTENCAVNTVQIPQPQPQPTVTPPPPEEPKVTEPEIKKPETDKPSQPEMGHTPPAEGGGKRRSFGSKVAGKLGGFVDDLFKEQ